MPGPSPVELSADCEACGLEGGVVEVYDALVAACRFGLPATTRCKLCAAERHGSFDRPLARELRDVPANRCPACVHELGPEAVDDRRCPSCHACAGLVEVVAPARFATIAELERALDAWAERERFPSRRALLEATLVDPDVEVLFAMLQEREPIAVLADPFANMGVRTTGGKAQEKRRNEATPVEPKPSAPAVAAAAAAVAASERAPEMREPFETAQDIQYAPTDPLTLPIAIPPPPRSAPPRALVFPLVSVITADGEIHPEERALVDRFLVSEGLAPLADHEFSVHHPSAVAHFVPPDRRERVVQLMCETAAIDGMPDESERRVIRAYATAWGVDDEKIDFWLWGYENMNTSLARQLFMKLRRFVLSARWADADPKE